MQRIAEAGVGAPRSRTANGGRLADGSSPSGRLHGQLAYVWARANGA
jgi:hypothetical protein